MKHVFKAALVALSLATVVGCQSTADNSSAETATANATQGEKATLTKTQLKAAMKELGYKCSFEKRTGSNLKKKVCSTEEQREARRLASQKMLQENTGRRTLSRGG